MGGAGKGEQEAISTISSPLVLGEGKISGGGRFRLALYLGA